MVDLNLNKSNHLLDAFLSLPNQRGFRFIQARISSNSKDYSPLKQLIKSLNSRFLAYHLVLVEYEDKYHCHFNIYAAKAGLSALVSEEYPGYRCHRIEFWQAYALSERDHPQRTHNSPTFQKSALHALSYLFRQKEQHPECTRVRHYLSPALKIRLKETQECTLGELEIMRSENEDQKRVKYQVGGGLLGELKRV